MKTLVICRRELSAYFGSIVAYVLLAVFLVLSGYFFYSDLIFFIILGGATLATGLWQFVFLDMRMVAMLILPLLTMRLFAEEKKLGTLELLWTYPVRDVEIVLGKFLAAWLFYVAMLVPTAAGPIVFHWFHAFDVPPVLAGYLGMVLLWSAFIVAAACSSRR
ncbi:MAG: ABC transporter permease [Candidatus Binatia bacterium]